MLISNLLCKQWRYLHRFARLSGINTALEFYVQYRMAGFLKQSAIVIYPILSLFFITSFYFLLTPIFSILRRCGVNGRVKKYVLNKSSVIIEQFFKTLLTMNY